VGGLVGGRQISRTPRRLGRANFYHREKTSKRRSVLGTGENAAALLKKRHDLGVRSGKKPSLASSDRIGLSIPQEKGPKLWKGGKKKKRISE